MAIRPIIVSDPVPIRRLAPPDEKPFGITVSYTGENDALDGDKEENLEFKNIAERHEIEFQDGYSQEVSSIGDYVGIIVAYSASAAPIAILIKSAKDVIIKWLDHKKRGVTVSLGSGRKIEVKSTEDLERVIRILDQSSFAKPRPAHTKSSRKPPEGQ